MKSLFVVRKSLNKRYLKVVVSVVDRDGWRRSVDALCATRQKADRSRSRATSVLELHEILKEV